MWRARKIGRRRLRHARMKHRRQAGILRGLCRKQKGYRLRKHNPTCVDKLEIGSSLDSKSKYLEWLKHVNHELAGGAAGSSRTLRKRRAKSGGEQQQSNMLRQFIQGFKMCLSGSLDPSVFIRQVEAWVPEAQENEKPKPKRRALSQPALSSKRPVT